jgi:hypothetical protein
MAYFETNLVDIYLLAHGETQFWSLPKSLYLSTVGAR